jgi:hypothetical protein
MTLPGKVAAVVFACALASPAWAGEYPVPCKPFDNIDPSPHRYQFEIANRCISPACMTQHVAPTTLPAGTKITIRTQKGKGARPQDFVLDQALEAGKSVRFDTPKGADKCWATASW